MKIDYYMDLVTRHGARLVIAFLLEVIEQLRRDRVQREQKGVAA